MTKTYVVVFAPSAERQLDDLYAYVALHGGPANADHFIDAIVRRCASLATFPERGTRRDDVRPGLRTMGHDRRVTLAFVVEHERLTVTVIGVFHGGQDVESRLTE